MNQQVELGLRNSNPDVLTSIANLSSDEVFTPPEFANRMLDTLEEAWAASNNGDVIWESPTVTFLDPFTKSGVFLREITKRLVDGLENQIPDLQTRVDHVLSKQVFGIAITELTSLLARRSVYCSKIANGKYSIATVFENEFGNIWFERAEHSWAGSTCRFCGASKSGLDRGIGAETYAYPFIHTDDAAALLARHFGADVKFDVIIGNPPYQLSAGETSDNPIYQRFVGQALELDPRYLVMVTPSRWFTGGKGLDEFRAQMIHDRRLRNIVDFPDSKDSFPGVEIKGGVSYFLWDSSWDGDCTFSTIGKTGLESSASRDLRDGYGVIIRDNNASSVLSKVLKYKGEWLSSFVTPQTPFGLATNFTGWSAHPKPRFIRLYKRGLEDAWVDERSITMRRDLIDRAKVYISYAYNGGDALPHQVIGKPVVSLEPSVCTQTYTVAGSFETANEALNFAGFLRTRVVRFLIRQRKISQHNRPDTFRFVPMLPMTVAWDDNRLVKQFGITADEFEYICQTVREMTDSSDSEEIEIAE